MAPPAAPAPGRCRHSRCPASPAPSSRSHWSRSRLSHRSCPRPPGGQLGWPRALRAPWMGRWGWACGRRSHPCWLRGRAGRAETVVRRAGAGGLSGGTPCRSPPPGSLGCGVSGVAPVPWAPSYPELGGQPQPRTPLC